MEIKDFTKENSDIQDNLTAKTSLLNSFEYTDTITNDPESTTDWSTVSGTPNAPQDNADKTSENISADTYTVSGRVASTIAGTINSDGTVDTTKLSGAIPQANLNLADRGWVQTCTFAVTDADTVTWGSGTFTSADGTAYSITGAYTGNMTAKTYIYLDIAVSTTLYQTTTTATTAVGVGKVLIAIAQNGTAEATFQVLQGQGGQNIDAANIVAGSITANEIAASTITSGKMSVSQLSAIAADLGTITAGSLNINSGKAIITSTGDATFKSYNLMSQYTAGENITAGHLVCIKHKTCSWGDDAQADRNTVQTLLSSFVYVDIDNPDTNYSGAAPLALPKLGVSVAKNNGYWIYGKLKIDQLDALPRLPDWNQVDSVKLRIYVFSTALLSQTPSLYRLTAAFDESTITWNTKPANDGVAWASATTGSAIQAENMASVATLLDDGYIEFDITQLYRLWSAGKIDNNGFVIKGGNGADDGNATIGGRTKAGGGDYNMEPYVVIIPLVNNPGSGNTITVNDGYVYHASNTDYNKVKNVVGVAGTTTTSGNTADIYALADRSVIPNSILSVTAGKSYYLNETNGTIGVLTNDIIENDKWDLKIGTGTSSGLCIDFDKNPMFIKSESYPGTGILPPSHARMAVIKWRNTDANHTHNGEITLYKDRVQTVTDQRQYLEGGSYVIFGVTAAWATGTSGLLTITGLGGTTTSATILWYK